MTVYSYYYIFSVSTLAIIIFHIFNMISFISREKDITGRKLIAGTLEYKNLTNYSSQKYLSIAIFIMIASSACVLHAIYLLLEVSKGHSVTSFLIGVPLLTLIIVISVAYKMKTYYTENARHDSTDSTKRT